MNNQRIDIELIARYYKGELDGKAMQELEERALEDPFLADAMDGFSEYSIHKNDVIDLKERLKDRLRSKAVRKAPGFGFINWYLAASIIILIGFISVYINLPEEHIENNEILKTADTRIKESEAQIQALNNDTVSDKETVIEESPIIVNLEKPTFDADEILSSSDQVILEAATASAFAIDSSKRENVISSYNNKSVDDFASKSLSAARSSIILTPAQNSMVKGRVIDSESKTPIGGVSVLDISTGISTTTDANGEFKILAEQDSKLSFQNMGYIKKESEVSFNDSLKVYLKKDNASLAEVAVIGYGTALKKQNAGPKDGWAAFKKYLNENNELETNETGAVVIEFIINSNGGLSDFKVIKSLSKLADARAIYLIKNYSSWQGASDGTASKAKVTLRFK